MPALPGARDEKAANQGAQTRLAGVHGPQRGLLPGSLPALARLLCDDIETIHARGLPSAVARIEDEAWLFIASVQLLIRRVARVNCYFSETQSDI